MDNLTNLVLEKALEDIEFLQDLSRDEKIDEIMENLEEDLLVIESFRYEYRENVPKDYTFFENVLPNLSDDRFNTIVRMERRLFDIILDLIKDHEVFHGKNSDQQFSIFFQLAVVMYRLGGTTSVRKVAALFGIGDGGTLQKITKRVFTAILCYEKSFIQWPTKEERIKLLSETADELPLCVGYLDGTEIRLEEAPDMDRESYYSRTKQYSMKLQAICDHTLRIREIHVGYPGSVHDARIFNSCIISKKPQQFLTDGEWIAADCAYKLTEYVLTPFRRNSTMTSLKNRKQFNKFFSKYRVRIEHCFGLLKNKFPILKNLNISIKNAQKHKEVCYWVRVCCVLHNIILPYLSEEDLNFLTNLVEEESEVNDEDVESSTTSEIGELKRQSIFESIFTDPY